jgi:hypothetical protein
VSAVSRGSQDARRAQTGIRNKETETLRVRRDGEMKRERGFVAVAGRMRQGRWCLPCQNPAACSSGARAATESESVQAELTERLRDSLPSTILLRVLRGAGDGQPPVSCFGDARLPAAHPELPF